MIAPVLPAMLPNHIFPGTMVKRNSRYVVRFVSIFILLHKIIDFPNPTNFVALIVPTFLFLKRIVNTLLYTNALILNALTIFTILRKLIKRILTRTMVKTNINSTTSTGNSG
jgi:hypothetical protein